jgi:hypothetical protein
MNRFTRDMRKLCSDSSAMCEFVSRSSIECPVAARRSMGGNMPAPSGLGLRLFRRPWFVSSFCQRSKSGAGRDSMYLSRTGRCNGAALRAMI